MHKKFVCGSAALLALAVAGCASDPAPFDPQSFQQPEKDQAAQAAARPMRPLPTTLESPFLDSSSTAPAKRPAPMAPATGPALATEPVQRLTLQEIIQRAVVNSLDVRVAGYQPAIDQNRVVEAQAQFDPVLFAGPQIQRIDRMTAGTLLNPFNPTAGDISYDNENILSFQGGVRQNLSTGGKAELRYQTSRVDIEPLRNAINPYYENSIILEVTQPLLRNFGTEVNRARITVARNNQRISLLDFRKALEENVADLEKTYWQLVLAERDVQIQERLLGRTMDTADILARRNLQDTTRVQTSQANAAVESRRATLVRAKAQVRDLSDRIKRLMNDPDMPVASAVLILPANQPIEQPIHFDLADQVNTALANRFDLAQQQLRINSAAVVARVAKNNLMPQLNLVGSIGPGGVGDDWGPAQDRVNEFGHIDYKLGLQFEIPLGNREARAIHSRAMLQRQQAIDQYRALVEQITLDVKTAQREVQTTWDEMVSTRQARFAAADALYAIELRERNNEPLTPTFVQLKLDTQGKLADAERAEAQALSNYNNSIASLERAKGTILRYDNVLMEQESR